MLVPDYPRLSGADRAGSARLTRTPSRTPVPGTLPPGAFLPGTSAPGTRTLGYGICRSWNLCGCHGYRGDGTQQCQSCGHGFGAHY
ncbi:hypothetical protein [Streptacidiphilus sp. EB129]|uniref:hypothetical protein n=1 Tax=Streptacidiphilus sp. EB129 TaxID=3156262 RepID=UPI003512C308